MKMKGILLTLLLSFAGFGLVGCGLFDALKEVSAAAAKKLAEDAKKIAGEAKEIAGKQKTDNPSPPADHSVCDEAIANATEVVAEDGSGEAQAAIDAAKAAETGTADDVTSAHDQAKAVKAKADAAKKKAEGCAKGGSSQVPEDPKEKRAFWKHYLSASVVTNPPPAPNDQKHAACPEGITEFNAPGDEDDCAKGTDCEAKAGEWKTAQEAAGYTCTEEERQLTAFGCTTTGHCLGAACGAYKEIQYKCTKQ